jgi:hypothetical protein
MVNYKQYEDIVYEIIGAAMDVTHTLKKRIFAAD